MRLRKPYGALCKARVCFAGLLRLRLKDSHEKSYAKRRNDAYRLANLVVIRPDFAANNCAGVICLLDIVVIDHTHFMGKKVALFEHAAGASLYLTGSSCFNLACVARDHKSLTVPTN